MEFTQDISEMLDRAPRIVIGFSGGLDSSVLLHLIASNSAWLSKSIALHVDHNIQSVSSNWAAIARQYADKLQCKFACITLTPETDQSNLEQKLRRARMLAFNKVLQADEVLLLAHHANDQLETMLYRLQRGSGLRGLSGIARISRRANHWIVRPLLTYSKKDIESYGLRNNVSYVEDPSNTDERYDRNFLRKQIAPNLLLRFPGMAQRTAQNALQLQSELTLLQKLFASRIARCVKCESATGLRFSIRRLRDLASSIGLLDTAEGGLVSDAFELPMAWTTFAKYLLDWLSCSKSLHVYKMRERKEDESDTLVTKKEIASLAYFLQAVLGSSTQVKPSCCLDRLDLLFEQSAKNLFLFNRSSKILSTKSADAETRNQRICQAFRNASTDLWPQRAQNWLNSSSISFRESESESEFGGFFSDLQPYRAGMKVYLKRDSHSELEERKVKNAKKLLQELGVPNTLRQHLLFALNKTTNCYQVVVPFQDPG